LAWLFDDRIRFTLQIAEVVKAFAVCIVAVLAKLPAGVTADGVSIRPDTVSFGPEILIELANFDEEDISVL